MKPLTIADSATIILGLQDEIRRTEESRYDHRLHGVLLVAHGMTCPEVAALLGDGPRTVEYWIRGFEQKGLAPLREGDRSGRPRRLSEKRLRGINTSLRRMPRELGLSGNLWDGKTLAAWIEREYGIDLGVRQCQRVVGPVGNPSVCFGRWVCGYASLVPRLRKPILNGRRRIKKTPKVDGRCCGRPLGRSEERR